MISIVITGYKEPKTIGKAIEQILKNRINENFELIVSAPDNETLDVARIYKKKDKRIVLIQDEGKGKPAALNIIFKKAKGKILVLTDADVFISENAIQPLLDKLKDPTIGAVSGHPLPTNSRNTKLGYWSHLLTQMVHIWRKKVKFISCSGYLYAIRKDLLQKMPQDTLSDDAYNSHIVKNKGYRIAYSENSFVYVKYPDNFSDWIKQKKRSAGGYNQIKYIFKEKNIDRSLTKESAGIFQVLKYPQSFMEFIWTSELIFARIYLWLLIFKDINIKKQDFKKVWVRIESTK
jgi:cellulose synthase/poly-beta-1,6-N-acetylglucosamine synthase-like glycosyltransferase